MTAHQVEVLVSISGSASQASHQRLTDLQMKNGSTLIRSQVGTIISGVAGIRR